MLSQLLFSQKRVIGKRGFAFLNALEEYPHSVKQSPASFGAFAVNESVLRNGIKLISSSNENAKISKVKICITAGSNSETINQKGSAHLATYSAFNGTAKTSGLKFARNLENLGASVKSFSDREKVVYEVSVLPEKLDSALELVAECIKFKLKPQYLVKEAKQIAQVSYDKYASNPVEQVTELLHEAAYGELTPLGGSIYAENLDELKEQEFASFVGNNFKSGNVVISSSGIPHDSIKQLVESVFNDMPNADRTSVVSPYVGGNVRFRTDLNGQSFIGLGFEVVSQQASTYRVLSNLLTKSLSSKKNVQPVFSTFSNTGLFGFVISGDANVATADTKTIIQSLKAIAKECPNIEVIKKKIKLEYSLSLEGADKTLSLLDLALHGSELKKLDAVTSKSVSAAASAALASIPSYVVLGKTYETPSFNEILKLLK